MTDTQKWGAPARCQGFYPGYLLAVANWNRWRLLHSVHLRGGLLERAVCLATIAGEPRLLHYVDRHDLRIWIDPQVRRIGSAMPARTRYHRSIFLCHFPCAQTQTITAFALPLVEDVARLRAGHFTNGRFGENPLAVIHSAGKDHLAERPHILRRGEQSAGRERLPGRIVERVVHLCDRRCFQPFTTLPRSVTFRQPLQLLIVRTPSGVSHAQRG